MKITASWAKNHPLVCFPEQLVFIYWSQWDKKPGHCARIRRQRSCYLRKSSSGLTDSGTDGPALGHDRKWNCVTLRSSPVRMLRTVKLRTTKSSQLMWDDRSTTCTNTQHIKHSAICICFTISYTYTPFQSTRTCDFCGLSTYLLRPTKTHLMQRSYC